MRVHAIHTVVRQAPGRPLLVLRILAIVAFTLMLPLGVSAQDPDETPEQRAAREKFQSIDWAEGPATGRLGTVAELQVPASCHYTESEGAKAFLELTHNIPSGDEVGLLLCNDRRDADRRWFVIYTYDASGYVRDDEKGKLDADAILASLRRGTEAANQERRERGWEEMTLDGWVRPPYYDEHTHNLTWSFTGHDSRGESTLNHSVRLLGRGGVLHADLVLDPDQIETVVADFDGVVAATAFRAGSRYSEWREGDKVAAYGLTALVAGGAGAVAMKTGLFAKLGKLVVALFAAMWKVIAAAAVGIGAAVKSLFKKKGTAERTPPTGTP